MNFLTLKDIEITVLTELIEKTLEYKKTKKFPNYAGENICNIFLEPSTRTKVSFQLAEQKLQMNAINLEGNNSSLLKNETLFDTVLNLKALGIKNFVIRSSENNYYHNLKQISDISIINAGDGNNEHPSQSLLDLVTIYEHFNKFENLEILIIGDIKNSRVFHSNIEVMKRLKMKVFVCAPKEFQQEGYEFVDLEKKIKTADVVMLLRVQHERHDKKYENTAYNEEYGINKNNIKLLKKNSIILHPGPVNHGWELDLDEPFSPPSKILQQVENGLYTRIAILEYCLKSK